MAEDTKNSAANTANTSNTADVKREKLVQPWEWFIVLLAVAAPFAFYFSPYIQGLLVFVMMWAVLGTSWNLLSGYTGQVSFGHAAFFGIGAYAAALPFYHWQISPWWGLLTGGLAAVFLAFLLGKLVFRLRGPYFALGTLACAEILRLVFGEEEWLTNGHNGIFYMTTWVSKYPYYFIILAIAAAAVLSVKLIMRGKLGYYFLSIREDQDAAEALGIDTARYKNISLWISAFFAGLAGAFFMVYQGFIDPEVVFALHNISIITILVGIIGGVGTIWGPPLGALIMVFVQELFRSSFFGFGPRWIPRFHSLLFGVLVIIVILYLSGGIVGDWDLIRQRFKRKKT
jgi:branched-chain amino acid transport system permease protein